MLQKNRIILASAGSGKTTSIVKQAITEQQRALLTTYTNFGHDQIREILFRESITPPSNVQILTWLTFLLQHGVRPYQNYLRSKIVAGIDFGPIVNRYVSREDPQYYFTKKGLIRAERLSDFAVNVNQLSGGLVVDRLASVFEHIYIDEVQDLAGYDLDFVHSLLTSALQVTLVGDPRQATYSTNRSRKNSRYRGSSILAKFEEWERSGLCEISLQAVSHRCVQPICDFADALDPTYPKTTSANSAANDHAGVFVVSTNEVKEYFKTYSPKVLRWASNADVQNLPAINFGESKGCTFERVLIFPTDPIRKYMADPASPLRDEARAKFYVALTRAKFSVAIVYDGPVGHDLVRRL